MNAFRDNRISNYIRKEENKAPAGIQNQAIRYRAGIKPEWIDENSSDEDIFKEEFTEKDLTDMIPNISGKKEINRRIEYSCAVEHRYHINNFGCIKRYWLIKF